MRLLLPLLLVTALWAEPITNIADGAKLLFIGDSITDMGRNRKEAPRDQNHILGHSFVFMLAGELQYKAPELNLTVLNRGISGNKVADLKKRWQQDVIDHKPDILTIMIGVNDASITIRKPEKGVTPASFETDYRQILEQSRAANPELKIVLLDPFVTQSGQLQAEAHYQKHRTLIDTFRAIVAQLAKDYDAIHIPTQDLYDNSNFTAEQLAWDGIHPLPAGHELIARAWIQAVCPPSNN